MYVKKSKTIFIEINKFYNLLSQFIKHYSKILLVTMKLLKQKQNLKILHINDQAGVACILAKFQEKQGVKSKVTAEKTRTFPLPPIVGGIALVGGIVLLLIGK